MSIRVEGLTKRFRDAVIVNRLDLEVEDGELFVLLGGSGSGKSTILRLIAGLARPDEGKVNLNGRDVTHLPPQDRQIGFVFQDYSLFRHMTIAENVAYGLRVRGVARTERAKRADELLAMVGLGGLGHRYPDQLSGGQKQRVALARALAPEPQVMLMDEPFGALDVKIRLQLRQSFKDLQQRLGITTILVTHDQEEAFELGDRVAVLEGGLLVEAAAPAQLYARPRTAQVARFVGGGNVLLGRLEEGRIRLGDSRLPFPADAAPHPPAQPVRVLIRPGDVVVSRDPLPDGVWPLSPGTLVDAVPAGALERLLVGFDHPTFVSPGLYAYGRRSIQVEAVRAAAAGSDDPIAPGTPVHVGFQRFHVLDPPGLRVLAVDDGSPAAVDAVACGLELACAAHGMGILLGLTTPRRTPKQTRSHVEKTRAHWAERLPELGATWKDGGSVPWVALEAQESACDIVVLAHAVEAGRPRLRDAARQALEGPRIPTLLVNGPARSLRRVLVLATGNDTGMEEVVLAARLVERVRGHAKLLCIHPAAEGDGSEAKHILRRLELDKFAIEAQGATCDVALAAGPVEEELARQVAAMDPDLVIASLPVPVSPWGAGADVEAALALLPDRPVLLVPRNG